MVTHSIRNLQERLSVHPSFVQAFTYDGRAYIAKDSEPYTQFWLSERERQLLGHFGQRGGLAMGEALRRQLLALGKPNDAEEQRRCLGAIAGMRAAGVLMAAQAETSRYGQAIAEDYIAHRPYPAKVVQHLVRQARIGPQKAVLDLAGGPGDLALALAQHSPQVSMLELSRGFAATAKRRAKAQGLSLRTVHDSANRLALRDESYDVISVSQALHWMDEVMVCKGVCKNLRAQGSFFVIHSAIDLPDAHPLAYLLGHDSILGAKPRQAFMDEVAPLARRLNALLGALHHGDSKHALGLRSVAWFTQSRPFGEGYARGFLTGEHLAVTGQAPADFWADVRSRCAQQTPKALRGQHHWAVLHFQRGASGHAVLPQRATPMAYRGPR